MSLLYNVEFYTAEIEEDDFVLKYDEFRDVILTKLKDYLPIEFKNYTVRLER